MRILSLPATLRRLFAILTALAVLFAPVVARAGEVGQSAPHDAVEMGEAGECQTPPTSQTKHEKMAGNDCASMCVAAAIAPAAPVMAELAQAASATFAIPAFLAGSPGELATPPPKQS